MKNFAYDFDDAVWLGEAKYCFQYYCTHAAVILAGNQFLADHASAYSKNVHIIPTSVNLNRYKQIELKRGASFNVGWLGSSIGFAYFQPIEHQLLSFFEKHNDARLCIVADRFPTELKLLSKYIDFYPWRMDEDVYRINNFDVGLMPLFDNDIERGKCSFKMLQYMACEIPVIVSAVGMNVDVIKKEKEYGHFGSLAFSHEGWAEWLNYYYAMPKMSLRKIGATGRRVIADYYASEVIGKKISKLFTRYL
ncbi:MAG: glycosyltransferase [Cyclobacteriaceae bacterium]|nr:glycosyltransferase [Cyclobacteriaceae bacterium]